MVVRLDHVACFIVNANHGIMCVRKNFAYSSGTLIPSSDIHEARRLLGAGRCAKFANLFVYMLEHPSRQEAENSYISSVLKRCRSRVVSYVRIDSKRRDFQRSLRKLPDG